MMTRRPTLREMDELLSFTPLLSAEGFMPVVREGGGTKDGNGVMTMPYPIYHETVEQFFQAASRECWIDYDYDPSHVGDMLKNHDIIGNADVHQLKTMLTYCVRGERFSDGLWGSVIEDGTILRLLHRLERIRQAVPDAYSASPGKGQK